MLNVKRDNTKAVIAVGTDLPFDCEGTKTSIYEFEFEMQTPARAELLVRYVHNRLETEIEKTRREAYEQGWKDAKSRKPKVTWFPGWL